MNHVVFVSGEFFTPSSKSVGGLGTYLWKITNLLIERGLQVSIVIPKDYDKQEEIGPHCTITYVKIPREYPSLFLRVLNRISVDLFDFSVVHFWRSLLRSKLIANALLKIHERTPINMVQYSNLGGHNFYHPKNIPYTIRLSSVTAMYSKMGKGYYGLPSAKLRADILFENLALRKARSIHSPSAAMIKRVKLNKEAITAVIMTPYFEYLNERAQEVSVPGYYIFYFGSIDFRKGCDLLLNAFEKIKNPEYKLVFAGRFQGSANEDLSIKKRIVHDLSGRIIYLNELDKKQLISWIKRAEIITLPSRIDNFPNTMVESLQQAKIVIGPDNWGFEQIITDGVNGFLFKSGDEQSLLNKMNQVLNLSTEDKLLVGENARKSVDKLRPEVIAEQLLNFYQETFKHCIN